MKCETTLANYHFANVIRVTIKFLMTSIIHNLDKEPVFPWHQLTAIERQELAHGCRGGQQSGKSFCHGCYIRALLITQNKTTYYGNVNSRCSLRILHSLNQQQTHNTGPEMDGLQRPYSPHREFKSLQRTQILKKTLLHAIQPGACPLQLLASTTVNER